MSIVDRTFRKHWSIRGDKKRLDYDAIYEDMYSPDRYSFTFTSLIDFSIDPLGKKVRLLTKAGAYTDGKKFVTILLTKARYDKIYLSKSFYNCIIDSDTHPEYFDASDPLMKQRLVDFIIDRARIWVDLIEVEDWAAQEGNESNSDGSESGDVFSDDIFDSDLNYDMADDMADDMAHETPATTSQPTTATATTVAAEPPARRHSTRIAARYRRHSTRIAARYRRRSTRIARTD